MKTLEVRCCCNPNKVLGRMTHPRLQSLGDAWWFSLIDNSVLPVRIVVPGQLSTTTLSVKKLELTVDRVSEANGRTFEAIKNRDYPLEDLVRLPGFVPADVDDWLPWGFQNGR